MANNNSRIGLFFFQAQSTFMATLSNIFYRKQEQATTMCSLTIIAFIFTILLNFLQLKYQRTDPFSTHPKTMRVSVTSLLLYCLIYGLKQRFSRHPIYRKLSDMARHLMIFFTALSLASTASLLFPDPVSHVVFSLCFLLFGGEMLLWVSRKIMQHFEDESYFQRRGRRMTIVFYPMEQRFTLPV
ncbi:unnamed protein product [Withania somnifera]